MACCGGGARPQRVRRQVVVQPEIQKVGDSQTPVVQKRISHRQSQAASAQRQYTVPRQQCTKCGYPLMVVHIANRERMQCSNVNCRVVA